MLVAGCGGRSSAGGSGRRSCELLEPADDLAMMRDARGLGVVDRSSAGGVADDLARLLELLMISR